MPFLNLFLGSPNQPQHGCLDMEQTALGEGHGMGFTTGFVRG